VIRLLSIVGLVALSVAAWGAPIGGRAPATPPQQQPPLASAPSRRACAADVPCCPAAVTRDYYREGPGPPKRILHVAPDLTTVAKPYPSGVVILELAINEKGVVASSCLLRGIRSDFDKAAQLAALGWRFEPYLLKGKPTGVVMTVTVGTPDFDKDGRKREGGAEP
jgi:TonB family protein